MAKAKSKAIRPVGMGVGTSSLLLIFVILGMTILALLSFSVAQRDERIGARVQESMHNHYLAQIRGAESLQAMAAVLVETSESATDDGDYFRSSSAKLQTLGWEEKGDEVFRLRVPITDQQAMDYGIRLLPLSEEGEYEMVYERSVVTKDWEPDQSQNVFMP